MILLHTALAIEARPWIERWRMRQVESSRRGSLYRAAQADRMLVVSGTGALAAASSVSAVLATEPSIEAALSVGLAGCPLPEVEAGEARFIHQLHDAASGRTYYPDVLVRHPWKEAALSTHGRMVTAVDAPTTLVDMEGSGFFVAAARTLPAHRIGLVKVVSDHLEGTRLEPARALAWIAAQAERVESFLESWIEERPKTLPPLPESVVVRSERLASVWKLTVTQRHQLLDAVRSAFYRGRREWALLDSPAPSASNKKTRNRAFKILCDELAAPI